MLSTLSTILATMLNDERTFARAEALYAESFRDANTFKAKDDYYPRAELVRYLMEPIYKIVSCQKMAPTYHLDEEEDSDVWDSLDDPEILKPGLSGQEAELLVDHVEFVELCNYKGEGEGFKLACRTKHLRIYRSKYNYQAA